MLIVAAIGYSMTYKEPEKGKLTLIKEQMQLMQNNLQYIVAHCQDENIKKEAKFDFYMLRDIKLEIYNIQKVKRRQPNQLMVAGYQKTFNSVKEEWYW